MKRRTKAWAALYDDSGGVIELHHREPCHSGDRCGDGNHPTDYYTVRVVQGTFTYDDGKPSRRRARKGGGR